LIRESVPSILQVDVNVQLPVYERLKGAKVSSLPCALYHRITIRLKQSLRSVNTGELERAAIYPMDADGRFISHTQTIYTTGLLCIY
jgi:hypothetical protein